MVSRFLLHDPSDMGIGGISGKRKLSGWGGNLKWHRCFQEVFAPWKASYAEAVHSNVLALPLRRSVKGCKTCAQLGRKGR
jgi:hypothetical protein